MNLIDTIMIYALPPLPYADDALEPLMSKETIDYHYGRHTKAYIDKLNSLIKDTQYEDMTLEEIIMTSTGATFNNAAQVWNHIFFFNSLTPEENSMPDKLKHAVIRDFGSIDNFEKALMDAATALFGSGWIWLAEDKDGKLHVISEQNAGNPFIDGLKPLMNIDVWEHAYYIDYRNRRADFVKNVLELIDWDIVEERMVSGQNFI